MVEIETFLTAYDPSDLPGSSIDPLGFEQGYLFLAEKILPGLTNVANRPRYFSMLCTGAYLAGDLLHESPRTQYNQRLDRVTRFERFWSIANVLAVIEEEDPEEALLGLRGVTYARAKADSLIQQNQKWIKADFKLLSRQVQYGGIGMYGMVAERLRFLDRTVLALSPDLGVKLAEAFIAETSLPKSLQKAVEEDGEVGIEALKAWGRRSHICGTVGKIESRCLNDALHLDPVRSRMTKILSKHPFLERDTELKRLSRIQTALKGDNKNQDLRESITAILFYEESYRWALLAFERLLWLCRQDQSGSVSYKTLYSDPVIEKVIKNLPKAVNGFLRVLETGTTENFQKDKEYLDDVKDYLKEAASSCANEASLIDNVMTRHEDIQRGKFDKGQKKMPWIEFVSQGKIALTTTRVGGRSSETKDPRNIRPHPYRLDAADALYEASR